MSMDTLREVPASYLLKWQRALDILAEVFQVPAALIMRVWPEQIEVLLASVGQSNPYEPHEMADLGTGLYCETVMATRELLMVPDALKDPEWDHNPDLVLDMINYLGVPLIWPEDEIFGTICVLDCQARTYSGLYQQLLWLFKEVIEADFRKIQRAADRPTTDAMRIKQLEGEVDALLLERGAAPRYSREADSIVARVQTEATET